MGVYRVVKLEIVGTKYQIIWLRL